MIHGSNWALATLTCEQARQRLWDVAVVGAGPAGAMAAREVARRGGSVLLIDKAVFPRQKVCGGCLSAAVVAQLEACGLGTLPEQIGGRRFEKLRLCSGGQQATVPLPAGMAVSRLAFDAALVQKAIEAGAAFLPQAHVELGKAERPNNTDVRQLAVTQDGGQTSVPCRLVLAADGLGGRLVDGVPECRPRIEQASRIGAGIVLDNSPPEYETGVVYMACVPSGYLGLVRVEGNGLDLAAALDRTFVQQAGGPGSAAAEIVRQAGLPLIDGLGDLPWKATPALTRRRPRLAAERLFVIGDAASYVEPFTGEGILWALTSAVAAAPLAIRAAAGWSDSLAAEWEAKHRQLVTRQQRWCRWTAGVLRRPWLARGIVALLDKAPWLASPVVRRVQSRFST